MAHFEPFITEVHLYCEDTLLNEKIIKENFSNLKLHNSTDLKIDNTPHRIDFSLDLDYFDAKEITSILGEPIYNIPREKCEIYFANSKEEFIKLKHFKGIILCLESSYVDTAKACTIVLKEKEQAVNVICSIYYALNSYHIFPYDLYMVLGCDCTIHIENIEVQQAGSLLSILWDYRDSVSNSCLKIAFIHTKDSSILQLKKSELYHHIIQTLNTNFLYDMNSDLTVAINYTKEFITN